MSNSKSNGVPLLLCQWAWAPGLWSASFLRRYGGGGRCACVAIAIFVLAATACGSNSSNCCSVPVPVAVDVPVTWTVDSTPALAGCPAVGATVVAAEFGALSVQPMPLVNCEGGGATYRADLFAPTPIAPSAGWLTARLLAGDGSEITAKRVYLEWLNGHVSATVPFAIAAPGGSIRFRWCQPLSGSGTISLMADGPMWREVTATAPASELVMGALAPGQYDLMSELGGGVAGISFPWTSVQVVNAAETLVTASSCPP